VAKPKEYAKNKEQETKQRGRKGNKTTVGHEDLRTACVFILSSKLYIQSLNFSENILLNRKITNSFLRLKPGHCILSIHFKIQKAFSEKESWIPVYSWQDAARMAGWIYNNRIQGHRYFSCTHFCNFSSQKRVSLQSGIPAAHWLQVA